MAQPLSRIDTASIRSTRRPPSFMGGLMKRKMAPPLCSPKGGNSRDRGEVSNNTNAKKSKTASEEAATPESPPRFPIRKGCACPVEQEVLQREWDKLGPEDKAVRRAQRARRGERCSRCGCVGYLRRNCPTCPPVKYDVRRDRWRLLSAEEVQKIAVLRGQPARTGEDSPPANGVGSGPGAQEEVLKKDEEFLCNVAGRGFLWGRLADEAVSHQAAGATNNDDDDVDDELVPDRARQLGEDIKHELPGTVMVGGGSPGSSVGGTAEMTLMMPSLSGSSTMSSGIISGFRRALVWADGGGGGGTAVAAVTCPSVVSSLDDIPGRIAGSTAARADSESSGKHANHIHPKNARFSEFATVSGGDSTERLAGDENGTDHGAVGTQETRYVVSEDCAGAAAKLRDDDDDLVHRNLTWRWPEFCSAAPTRAPPSSPPVRPPSPSRGYGGGDDDDDDSGSAFDCERRRIPAASGKGGNGRCLAAPRASGTGSPLPKLPKGSYLRHRGTTVLTVQENLHLVLERLAEAVREQLHSVCSKPAAEEMLRGPKGGEPPERYYGASTRKDFRDYFDAEEEEAARRQQPKSYAHLGALREGSKAKYVFDRTSHTRKGSLAAHLRGDYQPQAEGYRGTNVHAATDWRRLNTSLDRYASSGRDAMTRIADSDRELRKQGVWVRQQTKAREQRRQRANHLLEVYRSELLKEQLREIEVLHLSPRERRLNAAKTMQEQVAAADRIMRATKRYGLTGNMEDAHYVMYTADAARRAGLSHAEPGEQGLTGNGANEEGASARKGGGRREPQSGRVNSKSRGQGATGNTAASNASVVATAKHGGPKNRKEDDADGEEISPYSLALARPGAAVAPASKGRRKGARTRKSGLSRRGAMPEGDSAAAQEAHRSRLQSERLRTFSLAGFPLRTGTDGDTTVVPALIPIPEGFGQVDERGQRSYVAGRIMEALREGQVDSITGRKKKLAVPLWHRATEEIDSSGAGSVLYSDLIGQPYSVLMGPKRTALAGKQATG